MYIITYIILCYIYIQRTDEENRIYLVSCYQSSAE